MTGNTRVADNMYEHQTREHRHSEAFGGQRQEAGAKRPENQASGKEI